MAPDGRPPEILVNQVGPWAIPGELVEKSLREVLVAQGAREGEVSITFLDDDGIRAMNREYLGEDRPTDVIAFALHEPGQPILGDIYVGYEQARRQASELSIPLNEELVRLAIHGALHLLGYHHPEGEERAGSGMFRRQEELLERVLRPTDPSSG
jgi:probable rRNA maturation factor